MSAGSWRRGLAVLAGLIQIQIQIQSQRWARARARCSAPSATQRYRHTTMADIGRLAGIRGPSVERHIEHRSG